MSCLSLREWVTKKVTSEKFTHKNCTLLTVHLGPAGLGLVMMMMMTKLMTRMMIVMMMMMTKMMMMKYILGAWVAWAVAKARAAWGRAWSDEEPGIFLLFLYLWGTSFFLWQCIALHIIAMMLEMRWGCWNAAWRSLPSPGWPMTMIIAGFAEGCTDLPPGKGERTPTTAKRVSDGCSQVIKVHLLWWAKALVLASHDEQNICLEAFILFFLEP